MSKDTLLNPDPLVANHKLPGWFNCSHTTIWRWKKSDVLPPPDACINGRKYWHVSTLNKVGKQNGEAAE